MDFRSNRFDSTLKLYFHLLAVYLGVNNMKVDYLNKALKGQHQYEYGVEWGLAHPNYFKTVCSQF